MAAKPKTTAKRKATSVRVSKNKRGISKLQALAVASVLAIIGVVAVVLSHASGTPNYQYSWSKYCTAERGSTSEKEVQACKNTSAEAITYRLYAGLLNRAPETSEYKYWTQQFAGDRLKVAESGLVTNQVKTMGSDEAFVKALYTNMLKRSASAKEVSQWKARLSTSGAKKWSRERVTVQFATSSEAIAKNQTGFNSFAASHTVAVVQTAAGEQKQRFNQMLTDYVNPSQQNVNVATLALSKTQAQLNAAKTTAAKKVPTLDDLRAIAKYENSARDSHSNAKQAAKEASSKAKSASRLYGRARELAAYATDISESSAYGINKIRARYDDVKANAAAASARAQSIQTLIMGISEQYGVAEKKYEAEQQRLAATSSTPKESGGTTGASSTTGTGNTTGTSSAAGSGGTGGFLTDVFNGNPPKTNCAAKSFSIKAGFVTYNNYTLKSSFFKGGKCIIGGTSKTVTPKYRVIKLPSL